MRSETPEEISVPEDAAGGFRERVDKLVQPLRLFMKNLAINKSGYLGGAAALGAIGAAGILYSSKLLNMDPNLGLASGEFQVHVGFITLFQQWLSGESVFPLWNPIMGYGRSLIADPFLFVYNPFVSAPMFLLGVVNGTKAALILNFILTGLGMYVLARGLKLNWLTSLWCGLLYMMSGALPSHLIIGQIQLTFSLGWAPWAAAGLVWLIRSPGWGRACLAAIGLALFFFCGNLYHQVYGLFTFVIISAIAMVDWRTFKIQKQIVKYILITAALSLGLIAVQLLPLMAARSSMDNIGGYVEDTQDFPGSQLMEYAFLNYVVADPDFSRTDILDQIPCPQENYRYIGVAPVLLLLFIVPAFISGNRKLILSISASFLFLLAWAGLEHTFIRDLYEFFPILYQFRDPGRALSVGTIYLVALSGFALNHIWHKLTHEQNRPVEESTAAWRTPVFIAVKALLVIILIYGLRRVYGENRELIYLEPIYTPEVGLSTDWLVDNVDEQVTINSTHTISAKIILEAYERGIRSPDFIDGWRPSAPDYSVGAFNRLQLRPGFRLDWDYEEFTEPGYELIRKFGQLRIWQSVQAFPYAFVIPMERLVQDQVLAPGEVQRAGYSTRVGPNKVIVDLNVDGESMLVISEAWFQGWTVLVDRNARPLAPVGSYLAVRLSPGTHHVVFEYAPGSFTVGWVLTLATTLVMLGGIVWPRLWKNKPMEADRPAG
ncbi:MAG: hypothetical protein JXA97_00290 [Anaerolineales bacterium]|nr:hypothetical protein [Anaerolineales bacterium]